MKIRYANYTTDYMGEGRCAALKKWYPKKWHHWDVWPCWVRCDLPQRSKSLCMHT